MAIKLGLTDIADAKLGTTQVDKIYLGSTEVWSNTPPTPAIKALKFTSAGAQTLNVDTSKLGTLTPNFEYSLDNGATWTSWNPTSAGSTPISFGSGTDLYLRGSNTVLAQYINNATSLTHFVFSTSSLVSCAGNIMHLYDYTQDLTAFPDGSSTDLGLEEMFRDCSVLTTPPELPATSNLPTSCYQLMFWGCTSLEEPPVLPATGTLPQRAYYSMFYGCTSLAKLPYIGGVTGGSQWGYYMFRGCSSIKLSATQVDEYQNAYVLNERTGMNGAFKDTGGTFTGTPTAQTYYTANTIVS